MRSTLNKILVIFSRKKSGSKNSSFIFSSHDLERVSDLHLLELGVHPVEIVRELEALGRLEQQDERRSELEVTERVALPEPDPVLERPLVEVEVPPGARRDHGALALQGHGGVGAEVGVEDGVDGADVGGADRRHGEEAVRPLAEVGHALVDVEEAGEGGHVVRLHGEELAGEVPKKRAKKL